MTRQISTLAVVWTNGIRVFGLRFSRVSISIDLLNVENATVWCEFGPSGIIGPNWFGNADGHPVTVNTELGIKLIRKLIPTPRRKRGVDLETVIYLQDGATPRCFNASLEYLHRYFPGDRIISCGTDHAWPAHSPDLSPLVFLWGYLKVRVYANNLQIIDARKHNIRTEIRRIPNKVLDRVIINFDLRVATLTQRRGAWIEHIINYWAALAKWSCTRKNLHHTKLTCL